MAKVSITRVLAYVASSASEIQSSSFLQSNLGFPLPQVLLQRSYLNSRINIKYNEQIMYKNTVFCPPDQISLNSTADLSWSHLLELVNSHYSSSL